MTPVTLSLEALLRRGAHALVIGVGGGGDVVGALATARFLEFCGLHFTLGGLPWERFVYDPLPGPRGLLEVRNVRVLHPYAWAVNGTTHSHTGVRFTETEMAALYGREVLHIDINGGAIAPIAPPFMSIWRRDWGDRGFRGINQRPRHRPSRWYRCGRRFTRTW